MAETRVRMGTEALKPQASDPLVCVLSLDGGRNLCVPLVWGIGNTYITLLLRAPNTTGRLSLSEHCDVADLAHRGHKQVRTRPRGRLEAMPSGVRHQPAPLG